MAGRGVQVGHGLRVRHGEHDLDDVVDVRRVGIAFAGVHVGGERDIALARKAVGHVLDVVVQPEGFHDDDHARVRAVRGGAAEIGVDGRIALAGVLHRVGLDGGWSHGGVPPLAFLGWME